MINKDFNKVIITGYPKDKPELKLTTTGISVMNFTLVSEGTRNSEYVDVTVWGELAENVHKDIDKGKRIMVEGNLHRVRTEQNGIGKLEISANRIFDIGGVNG
ncbi:MAG: single-stranded DNA-binding protein [Clostridia bacterium]|nr:single-stranded DNA-binding protein [Clostridia bacterium]